MMPSTFKISEVMAIIRKKLNLKHNEHQGMILFAEGKYLLKNDSDLSHIYKKYNNKEDGFLYITYALEQVYG